METTNAELVYENHNHESHLKARRQFYEMEIATANRYIEMLDAEDFESLLANMPELPDLLTNYAEIMREHCAAIGRELGEVDEEFSGEIEEWSIEHG